MKMKKQVLLGSALLAAAAALCWSLARRAGESIKNRERKEKTKA